MIDQLFRWYVDRWIVDGREPPRWVRARVYSRESYYREFQQWQRVHRQLGNARSTNSDLLTQGVVPPPSKTNAVSWPFRGLTVVIASLMLVGIGWLIGSNSGRTSENAPPVQSIAGPINAPFQPEEEAEIQPGMIPLREFPGLERNSLPDEGSGKRQKETDELKVLLVRTTSAAKSQASSTPRLQLIGQEFGLLQRCRARLERDHARASKALGQFISN